jgi:hypothetical protein
MLFALVSIAATVVLFASGLSKIAYAQVCDDGDAACWSHLATVYTNEVRARYGKPKQLDSGSQSMLDNAIRHSKAMLDGNFFRHQDLTVVTEQLGCDLFCT